jgi:hypothetical protein
MKPRRPRAALEFYAQAHGMTAAGHYAPLLRDLPDDVDALVQLIQHLVIYDVVARDYYQVTIPPARESEIHIRPLEGLLHALVALEDRPLTVARPANRRLAGRCHHFVLLLVAMLRAGGIPARARSGFGTYFNPPYYEDHWVCESWNASEHRWALADPQFDHTWQTRHGIDHDVLDVPRSRFLVAGEAWRRCRAGSADPSRFGIDFVKLRGLWFIAGSLIRDVAALTKIEMLPWDVWGAQPRQDETLDEAELAYFDQLAELTIAPDASLERLRERYTREDGLRVSASVVNGLRNRTEAIPAAVREVPPG